MTTKKITEIYVHDTDVWGNSTYAVTSLCAAMRGAQDFLMEDARARFGETGWSADPDGPSKTLRELYEENRESFLDTFERQNIVTMDDDLIEKLLHRSESSACIIRALKHEQRRRRWSGRRAAIAQAEVQS